MSDIGEAEKVLLAFFTHEGNRMAVLLKPDVRTATTAITSSGLSMLRME